MQQVADHAGVSISTVSFVVNGTKPVTPETRERILGAIDALGYRRNALARALASRRSHVIAMVHPIIDRNNYGFVEAAAGVAAAAGYNLVLWPIHTDDEAREVTTLTTSGTADGVLLLEVRFDDERVRALQEAGAPFVLIGRMREHDGLDYVDIDFEGTVRDAIDDLVAQGHRHLGLVVEDLTDTVLADYAPPLRTVEAFRAEIARRGLGGAVFGVPRGTDAATVAPDPAAGLLDRIAVEAPETTGLILLHGTVAFGLVRDLRRRGLRVPDDMSMVAIAVEAGITQLVDPPLATYAVPASEMGRLAAEVLIARLRGAQPDDTHRLIRCVPHPGASVGPVPAGRPPLVAEA